MIYFFKSSTSFFNFSNSSFKSDTSCTRVLFLSVCREMRKENWMRITSSAIIKSKKSAAGGYAIPSNREITSNPSLQNERTTKITLKSNHRSEYSSLSRLERI